jgi:hypothetical protein
MPLPPPCGRPYHRAMRRLWPLLALALILGAGFGGRARSAQPGEVFLPDLRTLDPDDFHIADGGGRTLLLLSNTVWNAGDGPLEMRPEHNVEEGLTHAFQLLFTEDAEGNIIQLEEQHPAGSFAFHPAHNHWHFQDLALYELRRVKADGSPGKALASSEKISFCMFDQRQIDPTLENAASDPLYSGRACDQNANVGYSVSWGDEYAYNFADQDIDITGVEPGRYWVVSTADPIDLIRETDDHNNAARSAIELRAEEDGVEVRRVTETAGSICAPCGRSKLVRSKSYVFEGSTLPTPGPRPSYPNPTVVLSFKRAGAEGWVPFGDAKSDRAFTLANDEDTGIDIYGRWDSGFTAGRKGTWILRARYAGNAGYTGSAARISVEVD